MPTALAVNPMSEEARRILLNDVLVRGDVTVVACPNELGLLVAGSTSSVSCTQRAAALHTIESYVAKRRCRWLVVCDRNSMTTGAVACSRINDMLQ